MENNLHICKVAFIVGGKWVMCRGDHISASKSAFRSDVCVEVASMSVHIMSEEGTNQCLSCVSING